MKYKHKKYIQTTTQTIIHMQDEEEIKKHLKIITFSSPNNRCTKLLKKPKKVYENKTETTKNTFKQQHG